MGTNWRAAVALLLVMVSVARADERVRFEQTAEDRAFVEKLLRAERASDPKRVVVGDDGVPVLIGGEPADPKDWPASVYASMSGSRCSATVVGKRSLIIAAHCVSNGGTASFTVGPNRYTSRCTHWDQYRGNSTADLTMCLVDREVVGTKYERLLTDAKPIILDLLAQLTGFGCVRPGGGGGNDGTFRTGFAKVRRLPSGSNYDTVTVGGAALCFGDSGGAAYWWQKLVREPLDFLANLFRVELPKGARYVFGINSRGDIRTTSYLSSVYPAPAQAFIKGWADRVGEKLCGVHPDATNCREDGDPETPPAEFEVDTEVAKGKLRMVEGKELLLEDAKRVVTDALNTLGNEADDRRSR